MALKPTATDAKKLREVLDPDWKKLPKEQLADLDAACQEALVKAFEVYESKAKFIVVGQLYYTQREGTFKPWDPMVDRVALGPFPSEATARTAVQQLGKFPSEGSSYAGADTFLTWVLPYWQGTGPAWHKARKTQIEAEATPPKRSCIPEVEAARLAALGRCELEVLSDDLEFVQCIRQRDHAGACFPSTPSMGDGPNAIEFVNDDAGPDRPIALRGTRMWPAGKGDE